MLPPLFFADGFLNAKKEGNYSIHCKWEIPLFMAAPSDKYYESMKDK